MMFNKQGSDICRKPTILARVLKMTLIKIAGFGRNNTTFATPKAALLIILLLSLTMLYSFQPQPYHFESEYQYNLFLSWLQRGGFANEGPAKISKYNIAAVFQNKVTNNKAAMEFDLQDGKIVVQIEKVATVETSHPQAEKKHRYYLEQLLFRLNSSHSIFATDFITHYSISLQLNNDICNEKAIDYLTSDTIGKRLSITASRFLQHSDNRYYYELTLNNTIPLRIIFPDNQDPARLSLTLRNVEAKSGVEVKSVTQRKESKQEVFQPESAQEQRLATYYPPLTKRIEPQKITLPHTIDGIKMVDFIKTYRDYKWSREVLHNKISNREQFLRNEFPKHNFQKKSGNITLEIEEFQGTLSGNLALVERNLRDGVQYASSDNYWIDNNKSVTLATGESLSFSELTDDEIGIVAPFMNQLVAMHRVLGTKLLNFLLIPADVSTSVVIRDPERDYLEFDSYTDLMLMLSYYWAKHNIYFSIDSVKKVNNYVELSGVLVADDVSKDSFDFAEIRFSLNKYYRIDLAMLIIHTNLEKEK